MRRARLRHLLLDLGLWALLATPVLRRRVRRGVAQAIWIPLALLTALAVVMLGFGLYTQSRSFLDGDDYSALRTGQSRGTVEERLPPRPLDGPPATAPAEPAGADSCLYYRSTLIAAVPVFRLCFTGGVLSDKALIS
ncbi:hypothetical protein [Streptomyces purpureus]|uniref:Uncharacterized protein n=1 Tax=Streptomyces purpureus TaxID=1951 RepID=A0A918H359_9ACTN|nr:hypothetical protein [Streptomyces purpureus]GGT33911.1 hypothetical protein GCM10014713_29600 [Streptomyces purpureus]